MYTYMYSMLVTRASLLSWNSVENYICKKEAGKRGKLKKT